MLNPTTPLGAEGAVIADSDANTGYRFSWGLAIAGGVAATAITFFLLTLGSGFGLMLMKPSSGATASGFMTGGAIYFFVAQAFGFAVGGHLAGRLLGPVVESHAQEAFRAVAHGLIVWAVAVLATLTMVGLIGASAAGNGATVAALYAAQSAKSDTSAPYLVDVLFRPEGTSAEATAPATAEERAEAGRLLAATLLSPTPMQTADRDRLAVLSANAAGISVEQARTRISNMEANVAAAAEQARRLARDATLWLAASLLFGAVVAMIAAVMARIEDDRESIVASFYTRPFGKARNFTAS